MPTQICGVFCAAATPFDESLRPDATALAAHCRQLLIDGCHGIALLGSTGEANSQSLDERKRVLDAVIAKGIAPENLLPGTGVCAIVETAELTRHAVRAGVRAVVMLPPFYYKDVSNDGLFDAYARIFNAVDDDRLRVVLYHIPPISHIPLDLDLIGRLRESFPGFIAGIKDSGGKLDNMLAMTKAFPDLSVLAGADPLMRPLLEGGGAGCITATSNLVASDLRFVFDHHADPKRQAEVDAAQEHIVAMRTLSNSYAQIPTIKAMLARRYDTPGWCRARPPLVSLTTDQCNVIAGGFDALASSGKSGKSV